MTWSKGWKGVSRLKEAAMETVRYGARGVHQHCFRRRMSCMGEKDNGSSQPWPCLALPSCSTTRRAQGQTLGCREKLQEPVISSSHTFIFLPGIPRSSSSISDPAPCRNQSQDQARDSFSARNWGFRESQAAAGRGMSCGMAWLQPPASI